MATDPKIEAALALHRFGFGPRAGSIASIASDPRGALIAELEKPGAGQITDSDLFTSSEAFRAAIDFQRERKTARLAQRIERERAEAGKTARPLVAPPPAPPRSSQSDSMEKRDDAMGGDMKSGDGKPGQTPTPNAQSQAAPRSPGPGIPQQIYLEEAKVRVDAA